MHSSSRSPNDRSSLGILNVDHLSHFTLEELTFPALPFNRTESSLNMSSDNEYSRWRSDSGNLNLSDLVEDHTVDMRGIPATPKYSDNLFEPSEITGRSTEHIRPSSNVRQKIPDMNLDLSTEQILSESCSENVRQLAVNLNQMKMRQSYGGRTADMSLDSSSTSKDVWLGFHNGHQNFSHARLGQNQSEISIGSFNNGSDFLSSEEQACNEERAVLPPSRNSKSTSKDINVTDFSSSDREEAISQPNISIGRFFKQRSPLDIVNDSLFLPKPAVKSTPVTVNESQSVFSDSKLLAIMRAEYSVSNLEVTSPPTTDACPDMRGSIAIDVDESLSATNPEATPSSPLADILFVTKPIPLANSNHTSKVNILNVEEVYGNLKDILGVQSTESNTGEPTKSTNNHRVTSKSGNTKIVQNNENVIEDKENMYKSRSIDRFLSDTVSYTDSMLEHSSYSQDSATPQSIESNTMTNDVNRKRNRPSIGSIENKSSFHTPTRKVNVPVVEGNLFQTKSRLYSTQRADSEEADFEIKNAHEHQSPSSSASRNSPLSSTFSSPRFSSSKSENRPVDQSSDIYYTKSARAAGARSISPRLLTRSATQSQFGSSSDLYNSRNEITALKASCKELSWGSTKLRMLSKKTFTIKNMSDRKLHTRVDIVGPGFQIINYDQRPLTNLHAQECRTISIGFCPTMIGPAVGRVVFTSNDEGSSSRCIFLFGFGGHASMQVMGTIRDPHGSPFLCMGDLRDVIQASSAKQWFTIYNQGPLPGMVAVTVKPSSKDGKPMDHSTFHVVPSKCILPPESKQEICVHFRPRRNDLRKLARKRSPVSTIATLEIIYGDDANRQRVARLLDQLRSQTNQFEQVDTLVSDFPAVEMAINFSQFNENTNNIGDLFSGFKSQEVVLTLDHVYINETVLTESDITSDDTLMFNSMISVESNGMMGSTMNLEETSASNGCMPSELNPRHLMQRNWSVTPNRIYMNPLDVNAATRLITISNNLPDTQMFEVIAEGAEHLFEIRPSSGTVRPCGHVQVAVRILNRSIPEDDLYLSVYFKNDKIDVSVCVTRNNVERSRHFGIEH